MTEPVTVVPIGTVVGGRTEPIDDDWEGVEAAIVLDDRFDAEAVRGLDEFSHVDVVFQFHQVDEVKAVTGARHPRGNEEWPRVGIFAQRAKARPNRLGVSTCRLLGIDERTLLVADLDAIGGTPVLDIKPHVAAMGPRSRPREPRWVRELMSTYWSTEESGPVASDNVETIRRVYDAMKARDTASLEAVFAPDISMWQTTELPWGGHHDGHDGAFTFFLTLLEHIQSEVTIENLYAAGDHVVQTGRTRGTVVANGASFDVPEMHLWELRDGQVVRFEAYIDTPAMLEALNR